MIITQTELDGEKKESHNGSRIGMSSKMAKNAKSISLNTAYYVKKFGIENVAFATITFKENLKDTKEAQRRYNNFTTCVNRKNKFTILTKILEFQKRGAVHYHLLVKTNEGIRGNFDFEAFKKAYKEPKNRRKYTRVYANSATPHLRHLWGYMRERAEKHGFGRTEIMPIEYPKNVGSYLGKYVAKDQGEQGRGVRKISYSRKYPKVASPNFSWVTGKGASWRRNLKAWAEYRGFKNTDEIAKAFGPRWAHNLRSEIMYDIPRLTRAVDEPVFSQQVKVVRRQPLSSELQKAWANYLERPASEPIKSKVKLTATHKTSADLESWKRKQAHRKSMAYLYD